MPDTTRTEDWLDRLYADEQPPTAAPVEPVRGGGRLPDWWAPKRDVTAPEPDEPETDQDAPGDDAETEPSTDIAPADDAPAADAGPAAAPPQPYVVEIHTAATEAAAGFVKDPDQRKRVARVLYNGTAAGIGWAAGGGPWVLDSLLYYGQADGNNGVWVGVGVIVVCLIAEMRSHGWRHRGRHVVWQLLGWIARIPLATAVLALALYDAPTHAL